MKAKKVIYLVEGKHTNEWSKYLLKIKEIVIAHELYDIIMKYATDNTSYSSLIIIYLMHKENK